MNARLRSPFLGYFVLAQIYLNYGAFALLLWGEGTVDERVDAFSSATSLQNFAVYPIIAALVGGVVGPWITYCGAWIAKWPTEKLKKLQDDEARKIRIHSFEQAIEELQAEEQYNLRKVAVAESLEKAQAVGGDELVEEIKAGPSQPREAQSTSEESTFETNESERLEDTTNDADKNSSKFDEKKIAEVLKDHWNLGVKQMILDLPDDASGNVIVLTRRKLSNYYKWVFAVENGASIHLGNTYSRTGKPEALEVLEKVGLITPVDASRYRVSDNLFDFKSLAEASSD